MPRKPLDVRPEQCPTCIFRPEGTKLMPGRLAEIKAYLLQGTVHICHHGLGSNRWHDRYVALLRAEQPDVQWINPEMSGAGTNEAPAP